MTNKYEVWVVWGTDKTCLTEYSFNTQEELDAFCHGVNEANGWAESDTFETEEEAKAAMRPEEEE